MAQFMDLPGELRNRIYRLVVVERHPIRVKSYKRIMPGKAVAGLALLLVSKQIHYEAVGIFWAENMFVTWNQADCRHFIAHLKKYGRLCLVRRIAPVFVPLLNRRLSKAKVDAIRKMVGKRWAGVILMPVWVGGKIKWVAGG